MLVEFWHLAMCGWLPLLIIIWFQLVCTQVRCATRFHMSSQAFFDIKNVRKSIVASQRSQQLDVFERVVGTQIHISRMSVPAFFFLRHDASCSQVDDAWHVLRGDHVMTCLLESVHTGECSRHWSDFEYTSLDGVQVSPPVVGNVAFLLDLTSSCACPSFSAS